MDLPKANSPDPDFMHPGGAVFDIADRLAIINLVNAYGDWYDSDDMELWFTLFVENPKCTIFVSDSEPLVVSTGPEFRALMMEYRTSARDLGVEPVHSNTNLTVKKQTKDRALAETYMLYIPVNRATLNVPEMSRKNTLITGTGRYLFDLQKGDDDVWRICEYWITMKQSAV